MIDGKGDSRVAPCIIKIMKQEHGRSIAPRFIKTDS